jgi:hypothetical protein
MFRSQSFPELASSLMPWNLGSLAVMLVTGFLLFTSEALKCYGTDSFRAKMVLLFTALLFRFALYPKLTQSWDGWQLDYRWSFGFRRGWPEERWVSWNKTNQAPACPACKRPGYPGWAFTSSIWRTCRSQCADRNSSHW